MPAHKPIGPVCKNPFVHPGSGMPHPCGQCLPCLISRRRVWSHRIMLESYKHAKNAFVTLTYSDEHLPPGGTLVPKDLQDFLKRLRYYLSLEGLASSSRCRYFACGEYGDLGERPHYHLAIFGIGPEDAQTVDKAWGRGFSYTGDLTHDSAQYVAGYVTKKMTHAESKCSAKCTHPPLNGRVPEFSRMSLRPGIGALAVPDIADVLTTPHGCDALARVGDVPHALMEGKKSMPLGRYIRGKLREKLGFEDKKTPPASLDAWKAEMRELQKDAEAASANSALSRYFDKQHHFKQYLIDKNAQKVLSLEKRTRIFSAKKGKL